MNTSKAHNKVLDILWIVIWVILIAGFYMHSAISKCWECIETAPEVVEFYQVFLWTEIAEALGVSMLVIIATIFGVWIFFKLDSSTDVYGKKTVMTNNMLYIATAVVLVAYIIFSLLCLKAYSLWFILYGAAIIAAIVSVCINNKVYRMWNNGVEDEGQKADIEDNAWKAVGSKFNIILVVAMFVIFFVSIDYYESCKQANFWHTEVNKERIALCYEHVISAETNLAIVQVEFVNLFGESGRQYSIEELNKEYLNYMNGTGSWSTLWQFCQDSIDIELDNQRYIEDYEYWCYGGYMGTGHDSKMVIYEFGEEPPDGKEKKQLDYNIRVDDKYRDLVYFGTCVEDKLMEEGLTLSQRGDRYSLDRWDYIMEYGVLGTDIISASEEQVYETCQEVANEIDNEPIYVNKIDIEMHVEEGKPFVDSIITELNGYEIKDVSWKKYEGVGFQGRQDWISDELIVEAGKEYLAKVYVKLPVWCYFEPDTAISVTGLDYGKLELSKDNNTNSNVWMIEVSFKIEE